jgi:hypothetical protein
MAQQLADRVRSVTASSSQSRTVSPSDNALELRGFVDT